MLTALSAMLPTLNASRYSWASRSISAPVGTCQVSGANAMSQAALTFLTLSRKLVHGRRYRTCRG